MGALTAGQTYTSAAFLPTLTYSVPTDGWFNYEDWPGNFLLVPPGNDLAGVNPGTSDFVALASSIGAARFKNLEGCVTEPIAKVPSTPVGIAGWIAEQPELAVSDPSPVSLGGLDGLLLDIRTKPDADLPTCTADDLVWTGFLLFTGLDQTYVDQGVTAGQTKRLYLLAYREGTLVVELDDVDAAPGDLQLMANVAAAMKFDV